MERTKLSLPSLSSKVRQAPLFRGIFLFLILRRVGIGPNLNKDNKTQINQPSKQINKETKSEPLPEQSAEREILFIKALLCIRAVLGRLILCNPTILKGVLNDHILQMETLKPRKAAPNNRKSMGLMVERFGCP